MALNDVLNDIVKGDGADFFGVADLSLAQDTIIEQGGEGVSSYPRAISIGIRLIDTIVDQLPQGFERGVAVSYRHHYNITNLRLDLLATKIASFIQNEGYKAYPIPASQRFDDERICAIFSHKLAAHLAGLGWIGKSCLLVTPEAGPRVRWVTVLTNAPLSPNRVLIEETCGSCTECVDACPVGAFTGEPFRKEESREVRYDAAKCEKYLNDLEEATGLATCGLCVYACPQSGVKKKLPKKGSNLFGR
ncbi:MAG: 4Fe-4S double cluster binding domain-containing protein [Methanobacteriaceae archaeon]